MGKKTIKEVKEDLIYVNTIHKGEKRRNQSQSNKINIFPPSKVSKFVPKNAELIQSPRRGEKIFSCDQCNMTFRQKEKFKKHKYKKHNSFVFENLDD